MRCIIIDDEPHCRGALEILIRTEFPEITMCASCKSGTEGMRAVNEFNPDFIFLDISMPEMNGFEMLEKIHPIHFDVIFTTAFDQYAIKAFRVNALDYLLKPIDKGEFIAAVYKVKHKRQSGRVGGSTASDHYSRIFDSLQNVAIPTLSGLTMVRKSDINHIASEGNYSKIHLQNQSTILVSKTLKEITTHLNSIQFVRIHRTYVINIDHLSKYYKGEGGYVIMDNGIKLNVSRRKKEDLLKVLTRKN